MSEFATGDELKHSAPGETREKTLSITGKAGVYRHPKSGAEAIAQWDPLLGNTQAEALLRVGFEFVRDVEEGDIKSLVTASLQQDKDKAPISDNTDEVKGILARLNAAEAELAKKKESEQKEETQTELSQEKAKVAAFEKTAERGPDNSGDVLPSGGVNSSVEPLAKTSKKGSK